MAPLYSDGYYVTKKNDTISVRIQTNFGTETDFYNHFYFTSNRVRKPKQMRTQMVKGYGFDGRHFVVMDVSGGKHFVERLVTGRLKFYQYCFDGRVDGVPAVETVYLIKDTYAEGELRELSEPRRMSTKFYKRFLKQYMTDQPMIWSDLDKFTFNREKVVSALNEFNSYYKQSGS